MKIRKMLVPTDMSELSCIGVRYALEIARELNAEVIVYHVVQWVKTGSRAMKHGPVRNLLANEEAALDKFLAKFADDVNWSRLVRKLSLGRRTRASWRWPSGRVDVIVMSTHGRTGLDHMLLGSVTERVVARAPCPVLAIPSHGRPTTTTKAA
jgi:nucleotide-binding universal stress UspA family protein